MIGSEHRQAHAIGLACRVAERTMGPRTTLFCSIAPVKIEPSCSAADGGTLERRGEGRSLSTIRQILVSSVAETSVGRPGSIAHSWHVAGGNIPVKEAVQFHACEHVRRLMRVRLWNRPSSDAAVMPLASSLCISFISSYDQHIIIHIRKHRLCTGTARRNLPCAGYTTIRNLLLLRHNHVFRQS